MKPYLELMKPDGRLLPLGAEWPAAILGENGWVDGPPLNIKVHNIPAHVDQFALNVEVYDGRVRRTTVYNIFQDPSPAEGTLEWAELIWTWTRWRPPTQNAGMYRRDLYLPPIARGNTGWVRVVLVGPEAAGEIPVLLTELEFTVVRT